MKRAEINEAVDIALAENGYSKGFYSWRGANLVIWDRDKLTAQAMAECTATIRLPSGTSSKRLIERLSVLPAVGPPRPAPRARSPKPIQLDIEDAIAAQPPTKHKPRRRSKDIPAHIGNRAAAA